MDIQERITSIINEQDAFRVVKLISFYDSLVAELHLKIEYLNKLNYTIQFKFKGLPEKIENTQEEIRQIYSAILFINGLFRIENLTENIKQVTLPDNIQRDFNLDKYLKDLPNLDNYKSVSKPEQTGETVEDEKKRKLIEIEFDKDNWQISYNRKTTKKLTKNQYSIIEYLYKNGETYYTTLNKILTEKFDNKNVGKRPFDYFKKTKHEYLYNELIESDNTGNYFIKSP